MCAILLCSNNPLLVKSLYGMLRDEGYGVEIADHPAAAVRMMFDGGFSLMIIDSEPFGLSVDDAVKIIRSVLPQIPVVFLGYEGLDIDALTIESPINLEQFKEVVRKLYPTSKSQIQKEELLWH